MSASMKHLLAATAIAVVALAGAAQAAEPESCKKIRMADVGWTDLLRKCRNAEKQRSENGGGFLHTSSQRCHPEDAIPPAQQALE